MTAGRHRGSGHLTQRVRLTDAQRAEARKAAFAAEQKRHDDYLAANGDTVAADHAEAKRLRNAAAINRVHSAPIKEVAQ